MPEDLFLVGDAPHISTLEVRMFGKHYKLKPMEDLAIRVSELGDCLQSQPAMFAFYASLRDLAASSVSSLTKKLEALRSSKDNEWRSQGFLPGDIKITEDSLRRALRNDPEVQTVTNQIVAAEYQMNTLQSIVRAYEHRRDMLISLSSRANNSTFNDRDVDVYVTGAFSDKPPVQSSNLKGRGAFPGSNRS